ncbi:MAG: dTDP-4-dehydrorhamnose 3,5-epimerase family protein [Candidatus Omnitrophica bacterium]|nr:dTDP-4-dehydrorhamnose 3,5-epimerase family protein [Candidatus Omnitrophota bacterium]
MIDGVFIEPLKCFKDERGEVRRMLRSDAPFFQTFGEVYFSTVNPGYIKGWKMHKEMTQHFAVPVGNLKLVLYDRRENSPTHGEIQEIIFGVDHYHLVRVPPQIIYSFSPMGNQLAMIVNCTDIPHRPDESVQFDLNDTTIPYQWGN